ncbi:sporulation kinase KinD [Bacillus vallismortis]|uniref:histidine kinase n=1 Tax=Bacillus vallismortis TaxID=72361 RepID=A0AAP3CGS5_BACVA|nr:sporulation kinase KinD [Bacillus vallismortis]MCI3986184.1 sporulation kinase KinD [Bacillus vallismortis]MCY7894327.1 sporulation kinase KinD [Bacillus vallismortis]MCY7918831.1 sporulation kinase KinD [Bacillus vallismortis]MCY8308465.1 sporulation kinase KinD [Bacillus vallismortis]MCY8316183.1 sporulation kinase KinD [Bacillus vallismortis]
MERCKLKILKGACGRVKLYIILVVIPALVISFFVYEKEKDTIAIEHKQEASVMLNLHRNKINYLIGETMARMTSLSIAIDRPVDINKMQSILEETFDSEPRFSGLYLLNTKGDVTASTSELKTKVNLADRSFFAKAKETKKTVISDSYSSRITGQPIFTICVPVLDSKKNVTDYLVAAIQIDYLKNLINLLSPDVYIEVVNQDEKMIFTSGQASHAKDQKPVSGYLDEISWNMKVYPNPVTIEELTKSLLLPLSCIIVLLNILFILVLYYLLKRKTQLERSENEAQKLELIGTLAASTAHEIRNPLTGISGFIQLLQKKYKGEEDQLYFSIIEQEIKRINQIVSEFLVLGKPTAEKWELNSLQDIIGEIMPIIYSEGNLYNVEVELQYLTEKPLLVKCTKDHIKQVILNVAKNGLESMPEGGKLTISLEASDQKAIIKVVDNGEGISQEMLDHIFLPFVTSKEKGTGLGLVVCKRIVLMYGGTIHIESEVRRGTEVTINLPVSAS